MFEAEFTPKTTEELVFKGGATGYFELLVNGEQLQMYNNWRTLLSRIPYHALMMLGGGLGWVFARIPGSRRRIARRNIERCFPQLDANERERLLEDNLRDAGRMLAEFALAWLGSKRAIARVPVHIEGLEHVAAAVAAGRGVLLTGAHFSHLELAGRLLVERGWVPLAGMYREHGDAAFEWAIRRARLSAGHPDRRRSLVSLAAQLQGARRADAAAGV